MPPLTDKGNKIMKSMKDEYGDKEGETIFYKARNAGKITGVDPESKPGGKFAKLAGKGSK